MSAREVRRYEVRWIEAGHIRRERFTVAERAERREAELREAGKRDVYAVRTR